MHACHTFLDARIGGSTRCNATQHLPIHTVNMQLTLHTHSGCNRRQLGKRQFPMQCYITLTMLHTPFKCKERWQWNEGGGRAMSCDTSHHQCWYTCVYSSIIHTLWSWQLDRSKKKWKIVSRCNQKIFKGWQCGNFFWLSYVPNYLCRNTGEVTLFLEANVVPENGWSFFTCSLFEILSRVVSNYLFFDCLFLGNLSSIVFKSAALLFSIAADKKVLGGLSSKKIKLPCTVEHNFLFLDWCDGEQSSCLLLNLGNYHCTESFCSTHTPKYNFLSFFHHNAEVHRIKLFF